MAEETLLKIIDELDTGMRRQFEEKFREIRMEFDKVFKEMFGGGHGTLSFRRMKISWKREYRLSRSLRAKSFKT